MILGRVVGAVWSTRKDRRLTRTKLLLVRPVLCGSPSHEIQHLVAVDQVDAGVGDDVVVCVGAPSRWSLGSDDVPVDAAVLGVVDSCQLSRDAGAGMRSLGDVAVRVEWR